MMIGGVVFAASVAGLLTASTDKRRQKKYTFFFLIAKKSRVYITETCGIVVTLGELQLL